MIKNPGALGAAVVIGVPTFLRSAQEWGWVTASEVTVGVIALVAAVAIAANCSPRLSHLLSRPAPRVESVVEAATAWMLGLVGTALVVVGVSWLADGKSGGVVGLASGAAMAVVGWRRLVVGRIRRR